MRKINTRNVKPRITMKDYKSKKIIAVDFDGTLVINSYPRIENPNMELINFIKEYRNDFIWILYTARHGVYLDYAVEYLKNKHDLEFDYVNENVPYLIENYGDCRKIVADYYIDDRNLMLNNWERVLNEAL